MPRASKRSPDERAQEKARKLAWHIRMDNRVTGVVTGDELADLEGYPVHEVGYFPEGKNGWADVDQQRILIRQNMPARDRSVVLTHENVEHRVEVNLTAADETFVEWATLEVLMPPRAFRATWDKFGPNIESLQLMWWNANLQSIVRRIPMCIESTAAILWDGSRMAWKQVHRGLKLTAAALELEYFVHGLAAGRRRRAYARAGRWQAWAWSISELPTRVITLLVCTDDTEGRVVYD